MSAPFHPQGFDSSDPEIEDSTKPWWQSRTILALIATLIIYSTSKLGILPPEITHEEVTSFLIVAAPIAVAIWGRLSATTAIAPPAAPLPETRPMGIMSLQEFRPARPWREFVVIAAGTASAVGLLYILFA